MAAAAKLPDDLIDPSPPASASASPSSGDSKPPTDLIDPAGGSGGGDGGEDGGAGQAFQYGMVGDIPFGKTLGAAVETGESYLPKWMRAPGDAPVEQTGEGWAQRYAENRARIMANSKTLQENHPYATLAGAAAPLIAAPEALGTAGGAMTYGAASGLGQGVEEGDSIGGTALKTVLGLGGGYAGAKIANAILPAASAARTAVMDAAGRLGVTMPRYSVSTPLWQRAGAVLQSVPGGSEPIEAATKKSIGEMGTAADTAAAGATPKSAGKAASSGLQDWIGTTSKTAVDARYNAVNGMMNQNAQTPLYTTQAIARQILQRRQAAGIPGTGGAVDQITSALNRPGGLTFNGLKDLRSSVGETMNQSILPQGMSGSELNQIYSGLSTDLERAAYNSGGQQGLQAFQDANTFARETAARREQLAELVGSKGDASDEAVFGAIKTAAGSTKSADLDLLQEAQRRVTPQSWNEISQGMVSTLGRDATGTFSPLRFLTDYGKISDGAKDVLFNQNPALRQSLDDLAKVSAQWKGVGKYANLSGTAGHELGIGMGMEFFHNPLKVSAIYLGSKAFGTLLAKPAGASALANWVRQAGSGNPELIRQGATRLAATASAQLGTRVDPMALASLLMERPWSGEGEGEHDTTGGGNQPQ